MGIFNRPTTTAAPKLVLTVADKINNAVQQGYQVIRFNIGASNDYGKALKNDATGTNKTVLSSNKGKVYYAAATRQPFARVAQRGIALYDAELNTWSLPPACVKQDDLEAPAPGEVESGITEFLLAYKVQAFEYAGLSELADSLTMDDVWFEEFNFDLPLSLDELLEVRNHSLSNRKGSEVLTQSVVLAVEFTSSLVTNNGAPNFSFGLRVQEIISVDEPIIQLKRPLTDKLDQAFYQDAKSMMAARRERLGKNSDEELKKLYGEAAINHSNIGSKNSRALKDKKARKRAEWEARKQQESNQNLSSLNSTTSTSADAQVEASKTTVSASNAADLDFIV